MSSLRGGNTEREAQDDAMSDVAAEIGPPEVVTEVASSPAVGRLVALGCATVGVLMFAALSALVVGLWRWALS